MAKAAVSVASRAIGSVRTKRTSKSPSGSGKSVRDLVNVFGEDILGSKPDAIAKGQGGHPAQNPVLSQMRVISTQLAEEYFLNSVPSAESAYFGALGDIALEQRFIQRQLDVSV